MIRPLSNSEKFLAAVLFDICAIAAIFALCIADKFSPTTAGGMIMGIVLSRKPPVRVDDDDSDDGPPTRRKRKSGWGAVSGMMTMLFPLFWLWDRYRTRVA